MDHIYVIPIITRTKH